MKKLKPMDKIDKLSISERKHLSYFIIEYCRLNIGINPHKSQDITYRVVSNNKGEYGSTDGSRINININYANTLKLYIQTFIHEWVHTQQAIVTRYSRLNKEFGYNNNPYEVEARSHEYLYKDILNMYNKLQTKKKTPTSCKDSRQQRSDLI
jgi:hypothetical protein